MGLQVKCGTVQDATFIEADPGSSKNLVAMMLRLDGVETGLGRRKEIRYTLAISAPKNRYRLLPNTRNRDNNGIGA